MRALGCFALVAVVACSSAGGSGADAGFPSAALTSQASDGAKYALELRTSEQPPSHGVFSGEITVTDATTHAPSDGLDLAVLPWMPAMGHGSSVKPTVTAEGSGRYRVDDLALFMPGRWELRTTITGAAADTATLSFDVQ